MRRLAKVACLGPRDSFSECAAKALTEGEILLCRNFSEAVAALERGDTDYVVLPVENSLSGGVRPCLELFRAHELFAVEEYILPVDLRLATRMGVKVEEIFEIYSHEQALAQCELTLARRFPQANLHATSSTAEALSRLDAHTAAVVGAHVRREGVVLSDDLADEKNNYTRFFLAKKGGELPAHSDKIFFCAVIPHRPGSLLGLLEIFRARGLNLTRIESLPVKGSPGEYRFFIELTGDIADEKVRSALAEVASLCPLSRLLGAFTQSTASETR